MAYIYKFERDRCWYLNHCDKAETIECYAGCIRYMEMHFLMMNSGIPQNRQCPMSLIPSKKDMSAFLQLRDIKDNILDFVNQGDNLYIFSANFGNGKTSWAIKMIQSYFDKIWLGNGFRCRGIFIHVPTLLTKIKDGFNNKDEDFELLKSRLISADIVVWDDIAAVKLSDFDHANLLTFIDQRKLNGLANIYTGNLSFAELPEAVGNRLTSRIWNDSVVIEFIGADRRQSK